MALALLEALFDGVLTDDFFSLVVPVSVPVPVPVPTAPSLVVSMAWLTSWPPTLFLLADCFGVVAPFSTTGVFAVAVAVAGVGVGVVATVGLGVVAMAGADWGLSTVRSPRGPTRAFLAG